MPNKKSTPSTNSRRFDPSSTEESSETGQEFHTTTTTTTTTTNDSFSSVPTVTDGFTSVPTVTDGFTSVPTVTDSFTSDPTSVETVHVATETTEYVRGIQGHLDRLDALAELQQQCGEVLLVQLRRIKSLVDQHPRFRKPEDEERRERDFREIRRSENPISGGMIPAEQISTETSEDTDDYEKDAGAFLDEEDGEVKLEDEDLEDDIDDDLEEELSGVAKVLDRGVREGGEDEIEDEIEEEEDDV